MQLALLLVALSVATLASTAEGEARCDSTPMTVVGWTSEYEDAVCSAARRALQLLRELDLHLTEPVVVRPLEQPSNTSDAHVLGRFDVASREIRILGFDEAVAASAQSASAFSVPMTKDLWQSYIGHEVAHAVVDPYIASSVPHLRGAEYIAGVVQLTMVSPTTRDAILQNYRHVAPWSSLREVTPTYYFMSPAAFAVKSYRHFIGLPKSERRIFVSRVLTESAGE